MKKKILFIVGTHGNEKIGMEVVKKLREIGYDKYFDWFVANPKAFEKNVRFLDFDLNRAYPGKKYSRFYEKRQAFKNLAIAKKYKYIIDFHEAPEGKDDFIIVPREKLSKKFPLNFLDLERVLFWPDPKGPISQILPSSVELEFGMKNRNRNNAILEATRIAKKFIDNVEKKESIGENKEMYFVFGNFKNSEYQGQKLVDFKKTKIGNECFYPLLVNQYLKNGIKCYKMKRIN